MLNIYRFRLLSQVIAKDVCRKELDNYVDNAPTRVCSTSDMAVCSSERMGHLHEPIGMH